jgi:predicted transposase
MFVSLQFKLELKKEDREKLIKLMRKQSSAIHVAYNMLKELEKEKTRNPHAQIYQRLRQLFHELPTKYIDSAIYKAKQYPTDKPVVFGGKRLFEKLCKNHLTGKERERLKKQWKEQRQGTLISIGSKSDKGNRLTRFEDLNGQLHLEDYHRKQRVYLCKSVKGTKQQQRQVAHLYGYAFGKLANSKLFPLYSGVKAKRWRSLWKCIL